MPDDEVNAVVEDDQGRLWIGTRGEASIFDGEGFEEMEQPGGGPFVNVRSIVKDREGRIWMGGNDGLWVHDGKSYLKMDPRFVGFLYEDSKGNLWTSRSTPDNIYEMALDRYEASTLSSPFPIAYQFANPPGQVFGVTEDAKGNIWFGTEKGGGRYDGKTFEYFREAPAEK